MELKFASKVYTGQKKKFRFWNLFMNLIAAVICVCVLIKIVVGDFSFSDISGILISFLIIYSSNSHFCKEEIYKNCECIFNLNDTYMEIRYLCTSTENQTTIIQYNDIENVEYNEDSECLKITAHKNVENIFIFNKEIQEKLSGTILEYTGFKI